MTVQFGREVGLCGIRKSARGKGGKEERKRKTLASAISWLNSQGGGASVLPEPRQAGKCTDHLCPGDREATPLSNQRSSNFNWVMLETMCAQVGKSARI